MQSVKDLIYERLPELPSNQRKTAEFFLNNIHMVALLPISEVAQKANVSEASIVRFSKGLGFKGYRELKQKLSSTLKTQLSPTEKFQFASAEKQKRPDTLKRVSQNAIQNIQDTIDGLDRDMFYQLVDQIMNADHIYCMGMELSFQLSQMMTFLLQLYSYNAHTLSANFFHFSEQIASLTPKDLLIAFSFSPYSRETVETMDLAKQKGIPTLAFTDKRTSPIHMHADTCIHIQTENILFSNTLAAITVILNAIITELNFRDSDRILGALKTIESTIQDSRYYIDH